MDVSVENPGGLNRQLTVTIPAEAVAKAVETKIRRAGKHAKVPGFRPGKVPTKVLYQRYGDSARQEAVGDLIQEHFPKALEEADLNPAGQPNFDFGNINEDEALTFTAHFEVYPDVELTGLEDIKVEKPVTEVADADIDNTIERIRKQSSSFKEVERESQDGDKLLIDYVGRLEGEAFEGGTGNNIEVVLGAGRFLPDLEKGLVGHKAGDKFEVNVSFPEDYHAEDIAGKDTVFEVTVHTVSEAELPEVDEEFIKKMGIEDGTLDALKEKIRESLEREKNQAVETRVKNQVLEALREANTIEIPNALVTQEIKRIRQESVARMPEQAQNDPELAQQLFPDDALRASAERRVTIGLLINEVISKFEITLDQERAEALLDDVASDYGDQAEAVKQYYQSNPQMMQGLRAMVMEEQVVDTLLEKATVTEKEQSLDELMNTNG